MNTHPRILIVGAGIGGLALAQGLRQRGIVPDISEQATEFRPVGAGLALSLNAMRVLDNLGIGRQVRSVSRFITCPIMCDASGKTLRHVNLPRISRVPDAGLWLVARSELHQAMRTGLDPRCFRMGARFESLTQTERSVRVRFVGARETEYDLVIGADGVGSRVRQAVFGAGSNATTVGVKCWQFLLENFSGDGIFREHLGHGRRVGVAPLSRDRGYVFLTRSDVLGEIDQWASDPSRIRDDFAEFGGEARRALRCIEGASQLVARDFTEVRLPCWHDHRVVLLGDAAHASTPNLGQGAAMAIEDAAVLARALTQRPTHTAAFAEYESARRPRVQFVQNHSARIGGLLQSRHRLAAWLRNRFVAWSPSVLHRHSLRTLYGEKMPSTNRKAKSTSLALTRTLQRKMVGDH